MNQDDAKRLPAVGSSLATDELQRIDAYWRAANYLSVGQIYLLDNPLLKAPLQRLHIKPRLLGHWGTTPGLNFIYVHMNRVIKQHDLDMIFVAGPGHGGPAVVANTYLEGSYSELYPDVSQDEEGMRRLFRQFSFPGGIPSHAAPETPGSINEGGELGYALFHAYGAVFDNPDLIACCVVGDGEAETGPLATSWHSNKFLNPARDGAVLPILHLNGYMIANPTVLARIPGVPLRQAAQRAKQVVVQIEPAITGEGAPGVVVLGHASPPTPEPAPPKRSPAHYLWALLIARIYEVFPLLCPMCGGQMRLIAFITEGTQIKKILNHLGVDSEPPHISPARGPLLWDDGGDAQMGDGAQIEPDWVTDWDLAAQPAPVYEVDQRISW